MMLIRAVGLLSINAQSYYTELLYRGVTMRKTIITIVCVVCVSLFCGGWICFRLTAQSYVQSEKTNAGANASLLDTTFADRSERELLELRVEAYQNIFRTVKSHFEAGSSRGRVPLLCQARADVASAKIELYRHTGERDKLHVALKEKIEALTEKHQSLVHAYNTDTVLSTDLYEAEIQLLDALLEQKRLAESL